MATLVSASINVWFISGLTSHLVEMVIFGIVALILEAGKVTALLRANIFGAMYKKIPNNRLKKKCNSSYIVY
jgi:Na+/H+ antiporter NhaB